MIVTTGLRLVSAVPFGMLIVIVPVVALVFAITASRPLIVKRVMSFALMPATVTVTVYALVVLSAALTVYVAGVVKLFATPLAGETLAPVMLIVGISAVRFVPLGTVTAMLVPLRHRGS